MKKILLLFFIFAISSCSVLSPNRNKQVKKNVIIIGAGISGLSAANQLKKNGFNPIVLEAQEKVGGRLKTDRSLGVAFDEGASWIHGPIKNPITKLANASGAKTFFTDDFHVKVFDIDGSEYIPKKLDAAEDKYNDILENLAGNRDQSFADIFYKKYPQYKNQRLWTYMLSAFLEFDTGGDIYKLSSLDFDDDEAFKGKDVIITNGYDHITNYLAQDIDVRLNTKVVDIDYSKDKVSIQTTNGNYTADIVLVTVPLGVLKKNVIQFTPALPNKIQNAINNLKMGTVNKFLLVWDDIFWEEDLQYIGYTPETKGKFNYFLNVKKFADANALMTFAFGDYSKQTETMTNEQIIKEIMLHLKRIYGNDIPHPTHMLRTKWNENPYSFGAYSFVASGSRSSDFEVFEEPIGNKVFFAGEHTIFDYRGTVHGAFLSGLREANKIIKLKY